MKKIRYLLIISVIFILVLILFLKVRQPMHQSPLSNTTIRYVALGDSYTIGEGATPDEAWPSLLTKHLHSEGIDIALIANPSVTGWTTEQLITNELQVYNTSMPTFATLLIGVNDWVQGVDKKTFQKNLITILDHMQEKLPQKHNLLLVTIPDFGATRTGARYANGRDISRGIAEFNAVIIEEAKKRNLLVVDIYPLTQQMKGNTDLTALDGLHPSGLEYALWEKEIFPVARKMLLK